MLGMLTMAQDKHEWQAGDLLSVAQAADYLEISRQRIHQLLKQSRLTGAYKIGDFWVIPFEAVVNFEPLDSGRPKKKS